MSLTDAPLPRARLGLREVFGVSRLDMLQTFGRRVGPERIAETRIGRRVLVLVNDAELAGEVLLTRADDYRKGPALSIYSRPLLGDGLLTSEGAFHRRQRRLVAPAFSPRRIEGYARVMAECAEQTAAGLPDGQTVDVAEEMMRLTLHVVARTLFGAGEVAHEADEIGEALTIVMRHLVRTLDAPIRPPWAWIPPWRRDVRAALARLDAPIYRLIRERRASGEDTGDLLSMLLLSRDADTGEVMSEKQARDEAMTLFLAGHETTANALAWTFHLLVRHPEIYARVRDEADAALAGRTPTIDDLPSLPYALQVVKEAMRIYPPAYALARQALRPTTVAGCRIPKGATVIVSPFLLHRDDRYFPDPERFDPDRFTEENERRLPRGAFLPFGGGPRICIGAAFALTEAHLILATLVERVTFAAIGGDTAAAEVALEPLITLRPKGGIPMVVRRRAQRPNPPTFGCFDGTLAPRVK